MKLKRLGTMILVCSFLASSVNVGAFAMEEQTIQGEMQAENGNTGEILLQVSENDATETVYETDGYKVTFSLQNMWESGHTATVKIENTGNTVIKNWALLFRYESGIENVWNAIIAESGENSYLIKIRMALRTFNRVRVLNLDCSHRCRSTNFLKNMN